MLNSFLKKQRLKRGITQEELASELNVSRPTYIQIEKGLKELTISQVKKASEIFEISFENFLNEREKNYKLDVFYEEKKENFSENIRIEKRDLEKFEQILLYIFEQVGSKKNFGETVLHKLLYFIDFDYFEKFEENIIGAKYIKNHHGPTSIELNEILKKMEEKKDILCVKNRYYEYFQKKFLPLKKPNLKILSAQEIKHIDGVLNQLSDRSAKDLEDYSHKDVPFLIAKDGEKISYESVFYRDDKYSVRDYEDEV